MKQMKKSKRLWYKHREYVHDEVMRMVKKANRNLEPERQVPFATAIEVANRALKKNRNPYSAARAFAALRAVASFISVATTGRETIGAAENFDLLPVGHPLSTRANAMTASALRHACARWIAADPQVDPSVRPLVASAHAAELNSVERKFMFERLSVVSNDLAPLWTRLDDPITVFGPLSFIGGNSSAARRARAQLQRRDRRGRFAEMGGGWSFNLKGLDGLFSTISGRVVGSSGDGDAIEVEITGNPDIANGIYTMPSSKGEAVKAILSPDVVKDLPKRKAVAGDDVFMDLDELKATKKNSPTGWKFSGRIKRASGDTTFYETEDGYEVSVTPNADGTNTFKLRRREMPEGANFDESYSSWGDVQKAALADQDNYEKELQKAAGKAAEPEAEAEVPSAPAAPELPPVDERDFTKVDRSVASLKPGDLIPRYYPTAANELELKKRREDDPNYEMEPADEVLSVFKRMDQDPKKSFVRVRDLKTNEEREFEVNDSSVIYDTRAYQPKAAIEVAEAPEAPSAVLPEFLDEQFDEIFDTPAGAYKPNIFDLYTPLGRTDQDSEDYTDDPSVLSSKFSQQELAAALRDAVLPSADGPADGKGVLEFEQGDELVPAEAIYEAIQLSGIDADMILAGVYDSALNPDREGMTNVEKLRDRRESITTPQEGEPELVPLTERGKLVEDAIKRNEAVATPTRAQRGVDLMRSYDETNESLVSVADKLKELQDTDDFYDDEGLQNLLEQYLPWSRSENESEREAFRGLWGLFMSLDGGASNDAPSEEEVAEMGFRGRVMRSLEDAFPGEDVDTLYDELVNSYGGYPEFVNGRNAIADGQDDLNDSTTAAAFYRLTREAARPSTVEVQRSIGVRPDSPLFVTYTTPGSVFAVDPRSFTTNNLADARGLEALQFAPGTDFSQVIFRVAPGDADTFSAISFSWFPGEQEHIGWGNYEVVSVRSLENPLRPKQAKVEVTIRKTDKTPEVPTEESIFEDTTLDVSDWTQTGPQAGSNQGGFFEDADGNEYYVKVPKSQKHAENEVLASKFYERLGVPAAEVRLGQDGDETRIVSPLIPGAQGDLADRLDDEEYLAKLRDGFVADAWLANWDVAGLVFDNVMTDDEGNPVRVDPGGALMYRARGAEKGAAFGDTVGELDTLRDPQLNPQNARIFGGITDEELNDQAARLRRLEPEEIDAIVDSTITDPAMAATLKQRLRARREDILSRYPGDEDAADIFSERTPLTNAMSREVSELERGDIIAEDSFVVEQVFTDDNTPDGKLSVQGYYPGHQSQRKEYDPASLVEASRGGTIPPKGDRDPLHKPEPPRNMNNPAEVAAYRDELAQYEMAKAVAAAWSCGGAGVVAAVGGNGPCTVPTIDELVDKVNADPSVSDPVEVPEADGVDVTAAETPADVEQTLSSTFDDINNSLQVVLEDTDVKPIIKKKAQDVADKAQSVRDRLDYGELSNEQALAEINDYLATLDRTNDDVDFMASALEGVRDVLDGSAFVEKLDPNLPPPGAVHPKTGKPVGFAKDGVTKVVPGMLVRDKDGFAGVVDRYNKSDWVGVYVINAIDGQKYMKASNQLTPINPGDDDRAYVEPPGGYSGQAKMRTIVPDGTVETPFSGWNNKARAKNEEVFGPRQEAAEVPKAEAPAGAPSIEEPVVEPEAPTSEPKEATKLKDYADLPKGAQTDVDMVMDELLTAQAILDIAYSDKGLTAPKPPKDQTEVEFTQATPAELINSLVEGLANGDVKLGDVKDKFKDVIAQHKLWMSQNPDKFHGNVSFGAAYGIFAQLNDSNSVVEDSIDSLPEELLSEPYRVTRDAANVEGYGSSDTDIEDAKARDYAGVPEFAKIFKGKEGKERQISLAAKDVSESDVMPRFLKHVYARNLISEGKLEDDGSVATVAQLFTTYKDLKNLRESYRWMGEQYDLTLDEGLNGFRSLIRSNESMAQQVRDLGRKEDTGTGVPRPTDVEKLPWDASGFANIPSLATAVEASRTRKGKVFSFAVDGGDIEDLTVDVVTAKNSPTSKKSSTRYSFKLTDWAARNLDEEIDLFGGFEIEESINVPTMSIKPDKEPAIAVKKIGNSKGESFTYVFSDKIDGVPVKIDIVRAPVPGNTPGKAFNSLVSIVVPEGTPADVIEKAMRRAGVVDARPATDVDAKTWIENRIISVFGGYTDASKNISSPTIRQSVLEGVEARFGLRPQDVEIVVGADNRIEMRVPESVAEKLKVATGVEYFRHRLFVENDKRVKKLSGQERQNMIVDIISDMFTSDRGSEGTLLSTTNRYYRGMKDAVGMSQSEDIRTGGADYIFTTPVSADYQLSAGTTSFSFYYDPKILLRRIDFYTNEYDGYGARSESKDVIAATRPGSHETIFKGGIGPEALRYILVKTKFYKEMLVAALIDRGITEINGRPIEEVITYGLSKEAQDAKDAAKGTEG